MIVGVDHIALACADLDTGRQTLAALGLSERFVHRGVVNAGQKRVLMAEYGPLHDIAVHDAETGAAIELTAHNAIHVRAGNGYTPVLEVPADADFEPVVDGGSGAGEAACIAAAFGDGFLRHVLPALETYCYLRPGAAAGELRAGVLRVRDLDASKAFFAVAIAARPDREGRDGGHRWAVVKPPALMPKWRLELLLVEAADAGCERLLDDAGWPCLACLTTSIEADAEKLRQGPARHVGEIFPLYVDGKPLRILLASGPNGELIELIEVTRKQDRD